MNESENQSEEFTDQNSQKKGRVIQDSFNKLKNQELSWTPIIIKVNTIEPEKNKNYLKYLFLITTISFFCYFHYNIIISNLNSISLMILYALNSILLLKCLQILFYGRDLFSENGNKAKFTLNYFIPYIFLFLFLFYTLIINQEVVFANLTYATQESATIILPILLFSLFCFNIIKMIFIETDSNLDTLIGYMEREKFSDEYAIFRHQIKNHIFYSLLSIFVISLLLIYYKVNLISLIISIVIFLAISNYVYAKIFSHLFQFRKNIFKSRLETHPKKEKYLKRLTKKRKEGIKLQYFTSQTFIVYFFIIILIIIFSLNLFELRDNIFIMSYVVISNKWILALFIVNLLLFALIPLLKLLAKRTLKLGKILLNTGAKKYFIIGFFFILMLFFIKILVFNLLQTPISETSQWLLSTVSSFAVTFSKKLTKFISKKKNILSKGQKLNIVQKKIIEKM